MYNFDSIIRLIKRFTEKEQPRDASEAEWRSTGRAEERTEMVWRPT